MLKVNEIFTSIQGEGPYQGLLTTFIRFTGCNLRCRWCDTQYAYEDGKAMTVHQIVTKIDQDIECVCLTGGEPMLQDPYALSRLIRELRDDGHLITMETNGSIDFTEITPCVTFIVDDKMPSSGYYSNESMYEWLASDDVVKYIIGSRRDYECAKERFIRYEGYLEDPGNFIFQPVHKVMPLSTLAKWIKEDKLNIRLQLQLHKYIWPEEVRGV